MIERRPSGFCTFEENGPRQSKDSFTHRIQRLGGSTYLEISGSGFTLSINLGNVDPANKAQVAAAIEQQAKDAEFNAEKHLRRAKRLRAVLTTTELE